MAILTGIGCGDMCGVFPSGCGAIMARRTITSNATVIKHSTGPTIGGMTVTTIIAALNMVGWFTHSRRTIMTRGTTANDIGMINPSHR